MGRGGQSLRRQGRVSQALRGVVAFNMAGIFGASLAPYLATWLAARHGLASVGFYLAGAAALTLLALAAMPAVRADGEG